MTEQSHMAQMGRNKDAGTEKEGRCQLCPSLDALRYIVGFALLTVAILSEDGWRISTARTCFFDTVYISPGFLSFLLGKLFSLSMSIIVSGDLFNISIKYLMSQSLLLEILYAASNVILFPSSSRAMGWSRLSGSFMMRRYLLKVAVLMPSHLDILSRIVPPLTTFI